MPGRHITVQQRNLFMSLKDTKGTETAAARAGFSRSTGYRVGQAGSDWQPPWERPRRGRRRPDPLAGIFEEKLVPMLEADASLRAYDLYLHLMELHPDMGPGVRRMLERRVHAWKLAHGADKEVYFQQEKVAGRQGSRTSPPRRRLASPLPGSRWITFSITSGCRGRGLPTWSLCWGARALRRVRNETLCRFCLTARRVQGASRFRAEAAAIRAVKTRQILRHHRVGESPSSARTRTRRAG